MPLIARLLLRAGLVAAAFVACTSADPARDTLDGFDTVDVAMPPDAAEFDAGRSSSDFDVLAPSAPLGCPSYEPPELGSPCPAVSPDFSGACEYGHDLERECNDLLVCEGVWKALDRSDCFGRCPAEHAAIVAGSACDGIGRGCSYPEGTCACAPADGAGATDAGGGPGVWRCAPPPPPGGCPRQRPPVDSECVREMRCDYGTALLGVNVTYLCTGESWVAELAP